MPNPGLAEMAPRETTSASPRPKIPILVAAEHEQREADGQDDAEDRAGEARLGDREHHEQSQAAAMRTSHATRHARMTTVRASRGVNAPYAIPPAIAAKKNRKCWFTMSPPELARMKA